MIGQALLFGLGTLLLAFTVRDWWGPGVGLASAAVYALDPFSKHYVTILLSEQLAAVLVLAGVFAYTRAVRSRHLGWWAATGALAGSLTLVRAVFVFTVPLVIAAALLQRGTRLRGAVAALACAALLLVPWLAWTNHTTGRAVFANWGQGYNLLVAAHGEGYGRTQTEVSEDPAFVRDLERPHRYAPSREQLLRDPEAHPRYLARADAEVRSRAVEVYRDRLGDEPCRCCGRTSTARSFSGRRTRTGTSRPVPRSSSCKQSTSSCSHLPSSASCSRYCAEGLRGELRSSSSRTPS